MKHDSELLNWSNIDLSNPRLMSLYEEMVTTQKALRDALDHIKSGNSAMDYTDQEHYADILEERLAEHDIWLGWLEMAVNMRKLLYSDDDLPST